MKLDLQLDGVSFFWPHHLERGFIGEDFFKSQCFLSFDLENWIILLGAIIS